jgi:hypothetical protein
MTRKYFEFVCQGCQQSFKRRTDKKEQSLFCRPCRGKQTLKKHGDSFSRLYKIWQGMKDRCRHHPNYAGKGVTYCPEWESYVPFKQWAETNGYNETLTIDRINPFGNYEPGNCRWITELEQARNRRIGLTWESVAAIRKLAPNFTYKFIAQKFLVSKETVGLVVLNKIWYDPNYVIPHRRHRWLKIQTPSHPTPFSA